MRPGHLPAAGGMRGAGARGRRRRAGSGVPRLPAVPGDGEGSCRQLHDGLPFLGSRAPCRRTAAPGDDRPALRRRRLRGDLRRVGRVRSRRRLPPPPGRRRLGPRPPAGDRRELARRAGLRHVALREDGTGVPAVDRGRVGVRGARRHDHPVPHGSHHLHRPGKLRRAERSLRRRRHRPLPRPADRDRLALPQRVRPVRRARQRRGDGRRLLRRRGGGLHAARRPRRLVGIAPGTSALGLAKLVRPDPCATSTTACGSRAPSSLTGRRARTAPGVAWACGSRPRAR